MSDYQDAQELADKVSVANAIERIRDYVQIREEYQLRGLGDVIHGIHTGTEWEAEVRLSDLRALIKWIDEVKR